MIRFLLDEHVPFAVAQGLRLRGVEALMIADVDMLSASDEKIVTYAFEVGLVVFTQDDDFLRLHAAGTPHAGIVYSKQGHRTVGELVQLLKILADCIEEKEIKGRVEYL